MKMIAIFVAALFSLPDGLPDSHNRTCRLFGRQRIRHF